MSAPSADTSAICVTRIPRKGEQLPRERRKNTGANKVDISKLLEMDKYKEKQLFNVRQSSIYKRADYRLRKVMLAYPPHVMYYMSARDVFCVIESWNMPPSFDMPVVATCTSEQIWNQHKVFDAEMGERTFDCPLSDLMPFTYRVLAQAETFKGAKKLTRVIFDTPVITND